MSRSRRKRKNSSAPALLPAFTAFAEDIKLPLSPVSQALASLSEPDELGDLLVIPPSPPMEIQQPAQESKPARKKQKELADSTPLPKNLVVEIDGKAVTLYFYKTVKQIKEIQHRPLCFEQSDHLLGKEFDNHGVYRPHKSAKRYIFIDGKPHKIKTIRLKQQQYQSPLDEIQVKLNNKTITLVSYQTIHQEKIFSKRGLYFSINSKKVGKEFNNFLIYKDSVSKNSSIKYILIDNALYHLFSTRTKKGITLPHKIDLPATSVTAPSQTPLFTTMEPIPLPQDDKLDYLPPTPDLSAILTNIESELLSPILEPTNITPGSNLRASPLITHSVFKPFSPPPVTSELMEDMPLLDPLGLFNH
jgi:hypothetical protein